MNLLLLAADKNIDIIKDKLKRQVETFVNEGVVLEEEVESKDGLDFLKYSVKIESIKNYPISDFINIFKFCVANALWDYIQLYEEPHLIRKIIEQEYYYFDIRERIEIERNTLQILNEEGKLLDFNENITRKNKIISSIIAYLNNDFQLNLKGFLTFRLKDYSLELEETVEKAVEDFLLDKEYNEFIKLLKYFVDIQDSKIETIHIILEADGKYTLYDNNNSLIDNDYIKDIASEISENNFLTYDDLLISSLITIAPKFVYIHQSNTIKRSDVIKTITKVFANRVKICNGCDWCKVNAHYHQD